MTVLKPTLMSSGRPAQLQISVSHEPLCLLFSTGWFAEPTLVALGMNNLTELDSGRSLFYLNLLSIPMCPLPHSKMAGYSPRLFSFVLVFINPPSTHFLSALFIFF
jgi:hypothetical protein